MRICLISVIITSDRELHQCRGTAPDVGWTGRRWTGSRRTGVSHQKRSEVLTRRRSPASPASRGPWPTPTCQLTASSASARSARSSAWAAQPRTNSRIALTSPLPFVYRVAATAGGQQRSPPSPGASANKRGQL